MLEKTVETYLVDRVRAAGGDAYKFTSPARVSVPDRIVVFPPARVYFVELKRPGGKLTKGQVREHERLRALGCDVRTLDNREAVDAFVREAYAAPAPYLHVYEYPSPFGGTHREFTPNTWNGQRPARSVPLFTAPIHPEPRTAGEAVFRFGDDGVCRVQSAPAPADERAPWPMLATLHLEAIVFAYNEGYSKAYDGREFPNPFAESGSQAAAWVLGTRDGNDARAKAGAA